MEKIKNNIYCVTFKRDCVITYYIYWFKRKDVQNLSELFENKSWVGNYYPKNYM